MTVRSRRLIIGLLLILVVGAVALLLAPVLIGSDSPAAQQLKAFFLEQIQRNIGRQVEVRKVNLKFFPRIKLELFDVTVRDVDGAQPFLTAKRWDLVLRLLPLFRREVAGRQLSIEEPQLYLRRDAQGQWNFLAPGVSDQSADPTIGAPLPRLLLLQEVTIANGALTITDVSHGEERMVEFTSLDFAMMAQHSKKRAELYLSAVMPGAPSSSSLTLAGTVTQARAPAQIGAEDGPVYPSLQFAGSMEATNVQTRNLAYLFGTRAIPVDFGASMNVRGSIRVVPGVVGYDMVLSELDASIREFKLAGRASLSGLLTEQPTFTLNFSSSKLSLDELLQVFPAHWMHDQLPAIIQERNIRGKVEIAQATVTGMVMPEPRVSLTGEFRIDGAHAVVDQAGTTIDDVSGTVLIEPDRVRVLALTGKYGQMRVGGGKATVSFGDDGPMLDLELNGEMKAADLIARVNPQTTFRSKNLVKAWKGLKDIEGITAVAFRMSGPLNHPEQIAYVRAEFEPRDVSFRSVLLPEPVTGLNGRLVISEKGGEFDKLSGWISQSLVQLQGRILPDEKNAFQEFTITTRAGAMDLVRLLPLGAPPKNPPSGTVGGVIGLSGSLTAPRYKVLADLNDTQFSLPVLGTKPRGRQASLEIDGSFTRGGAHVIHRTALVLPSARISARGTARLDKLMRINAAVGFGPIAVSQLPDWIRPGGLDRGDVEISVEVQGRGSDWTAWQITGWLAVTNGVMSVTGIPAPVRDLNIRVKFVPKGAELKQFSFAVLDSDAQLSGVVRNWQTKPFLSLSAESSRFDLDLLIPKRDRSPLRAFVEELADTGRLTGTATVKLGRYKMLSFSDLSCRVNITNGVIDVDRIAAKTAPGQVDGRIVIRLPKGKPASGETAVRIAGTPIEDLHPLLSQRESPVSGTLFLTGSVRANGKGARTALDTLDGSADLRIAKGRILRDDSRAIWKIISVLNLPGLLQKEVDLDKDGMPFDEITSSMKIENGNISTERILVNSPVIKLSAAGSYSIPKDELDYVVAVSPFGPYSSLLQSIPLFGKLIKGDRHGLTTALFKVTGSLDDPKVDYMPLRSIAGSVGGLAELAVDILFNVVTLPKEIIAPSQDDKPDLDKMPALETAPSP